MSKEAKLIKKIKKEYKVDGTIFIEKSVNAHSHMSNIVTEHKCSLFTGASEIEHLKAVDFHCLSKLIFATLDAKGLKK